MTRNYPKKCWYVAATCDEITESPLGRRLLGEDVVLWRGASGGVTAFENRCAHRAFPLSHSRVDGDRLICGYHGCTYDTEGNCVYTPTQPQVPTGMRVRVFPVLEEPPFVWIWLGQQAAAAGSQPPRIAMDQRPGVVYIRGCLAGERQLHAGVTNTIWTSVTPPSCTRGICLPGLESMGAFNDVEVTETTVSYTRLLPELPLAGWQADATGLDSALSYKHREGGTFVSPAMHRQYWDIESPDGKVYTTTRTHGITPETESTTHVFMQASRNYRMDKRDRAAVTNRLRSFLAEVSRRDTSILEMASKHSGYDGWRGGVEFQARAAALRARRIVGVMLAKEAGRSAIRPGLAPTSRSNSLSPLQTVTLGVD